MDELFRLNKKQLKRFSVVTESDRESGSDWLVQFYLGNSEYDDSFDTSDIEEVIIEAPDLDTAEKYAQQYTRKMSKDSDEWKRAEIVSINHS